MSIVMPLVESIEAAKMTLPHTSKDTITPVLGAVKIDGERWVATDRYTVGVWEMKKPTQGEEILVPRDAVEWVSKLKIRSLERTVYEEYNLVVSADTDWVTLQIQYFDTVEQERKFSRVPGNFPPVEQSVNDWEPSEETYPLILNAHYIDRITTYAKRAEKYARVKIELGKRGQHQKPAPVKLSYGQAVVLIQPNLITP